MAPQSKRGSNEASQHRSTDLAEKQKTFSLLALPAEIRAHILRGLLWHEGVLEWGTIQLYPDVLRVCKTLLAEGLPILYDNTMRCLLEVDSSIGFQMGILKPTWDLYVPGHGVMRPILGEPGAREAGRIPPIFLQRVRKIQLVIQTLPGRTMSDRYPAMREAVREFVQRAAKMPNLAHFSAKVLFCKTGCDPEEFSHLLLAPLHAMRGLQTVNFPGLREDDLRSLKSVMTSTSPLIDLHGMFSMLNSYYQARVRNSDHCRLCQHIDRYLLCAKQAADMEDLVTFKFLRKTILTDLSWHDHCDMIRLCRNDPRPHACGQTAVDAFGNKIRQEQLYLLKAGHEYGNSWEQQTEEDEGEYEKLEDMANPQGKESRKQERTSMKMLRQEWQATRSDWW